PIIVSFAFIGSHCYCRVLEDHYSCASVHAKFGSGFTREEQGIRRLICGPNTIDVGIVPIWKLLFKEVLNPFYVFQLFSVCLWFAEEYIEYSVAIIIMSLVCIILSVYTLRQVSLSTPQFMLIVLFRMLMTNHNLMIKCCFLKA
ncbi:hypothetical protein FKM82_024765, partial [Ascaphus truei]